MFKRINIVFLMVIINIFTTLYVSAEIVEQQDHVNKKDPVQFLHFITDQVLTELKQYTDSRVSSQSVQK